MTSRQEQSTAAPAVPDTVTNYVGGEWVVPAGEDGQPLVDPATGEMLASVPFSDESDVADAVAAAREAFDSWRTVPPVDRVQYLFDLKAELDDRQAEIARALVREHGKTLDEARGEIRRGIENVEVAAGIPNMMREGSGAVEDVAVDVDEFAVRQSLGVFAAVTPFNFPAMIPLWFLPYAVATGNTFVLKPSEKVPLRGGRGQRRRERRRLCAHGLFSLRRPQGLLFRRPSRPGRGHRQLLHRQDDPDRTLVHPIASTVRLRSFTIDSTSTSRDRAIDALSVGNRTDIFESTCERPSLTCRRGCRRPARSVARTLACRR